MFLPLEFSDSFNLYNRNGELMGNGANFFFLLLTYMLFITAYTAIEIPFNSMTPLVFPQKDKRVKSHLGIF
jgi:Na+/melibiose symporter-like transporter